MKFLCCFAKPQKDIKAGPVDITAIQKTNRVSPKICSIGTEFILTRDVIALPENHTINLSIK